MTALNVGDLRLLVLRTFCAATQGEIRAQSISKTIETDALTGSIPGSMGTGGRTICPLLPRKADDDMGWICAPSVRWSSIERIWPKTTPADSARFAAFALAAVTA
jgi:hypothetical protein